MSFPVINGKYIKLEFRKEFKKCIPQFLRILFWNKKIRKFLFFSEIRKDFKKKSGTNFRKNLKFQFFKIFEKKSMIFFSIYLDFFSSDF